MGHTLRLDISDDLFEALRSRAKKEGTTLEQTAVERLAGSVVSAEDDPLLQFAGVLDSDLEDIAEHHDVYLGRSLAEEVTRSGNT
jgi:hypothetical protein